MVTVDLLQQIVIYTSIWCTVTTILLFLGKRDLVLGLKKWFLIKTRRAPLKIRFHGANKTVTEYVIATKGKGESVEIDGKKLVFFKTKNGSSFLLDEEAIRQCDDGVNEISYNYKSIMPLYPHLSEEDVKSLREKVSGTVQARKMVDEELSREDAFKGVSVEDLDQYTDPKRLNRLIEYIMLAAKAEALQQLSTSEKFIKYTFFAAAGACVMGVLVWYTLDSSIVPQLQSLASQITSLGSTVINLG